MNFPLDLASFETLVRDAFGHLYDYPRLQGHALTSLLGETSGAATGTTLHRLLLETLERLRPLAKLPLDDPAWRPYLALQLRYVEALDVEQVAAEMGISERQLRRESARGFKALAALLWKRLPEQGGAGAGQTTGRTVARTDLYAEEPVDGILARELARLAQADGAAASTVPVETVNGVMATLSDLFDRHGIDLVLDAPDDLPAVQLERVILRQVLINVLTHVVELGHGGVLSVTLRASERALCLTIQRTGIAPYTEHTLPEESATARLHVAEQLLALHGSTLVVERGGKAPGEAVIHLRLPSRPLPLLLVIDDNPDLVQLYRRYLGDGHWRVLGAGDGQAALEMAVHQQPDVILLDVMMPEQDGWEVLQRLKHLPATARIPVVICSVLREGALAKSLGAADFIAKPVSQQALRQILARYRAAGPGAAPPDSP